MAALGQEGSIPALMCAQYERKRAAMPAGLRELAARGRGLGSMIEATAEIKRTEGEGRLQEVVDAITRFTDAEPFDWDAEYLTRKWAEHRQTYRFDPSLVEALAGSEVVDVPSDCLRRLPFDCLYVDQRLPMAGEGDEADGFFAEVRDDGVLVSFVRAYEKEGEETWYGLDSYDLPWGTTFSEGNERFFDFLEEMTDQLMSLEKYQDDPVRQEALQNTRDGSRRRILDSAPSFERALLMLLYLCDDDADKVPTLSVPKGEAKRLRKRGRAVPEVWEVGSRVGPALSAEEAAPSRPHRGTGTGTSPRPHARRGHWHTYLCGPGKAERVVKWTHPCLVGVKGLGPGAVPETVRKAAL